MSFDNETGIGRVQRPLYPDNEPDPQCNVFPPNEKYPRTCALEDLEDGDSTVPVGGILNEIQREAPQGNVSANDIAGLTGAAAEADNCDLDIEAGIGQLEPPAPLRTPGIPTGLDPFFGAGPIWIRGDDTDAWMERRAVRSHDIGDTYVPPALPCTSYSYGENLMSRMYSTEDMNHDVRRRNPNLRWIDNGNGETHLVDETLYTWTWKEKKETPAGPAGPAGPAASAANSSGVYAASTAHPSTNITADPGAAGTGMGQHVLGGGNTDASAGTGAAATEGGQGGAVRPMADEDEEQRKRLEEWAAYAARRVLYLGFFSQN
ncbi:hypothetical protein MFIFM68171_09974 [Madurella fahalii]|uniref:Uncharacterized protein n=1 Tax=Madurella fahalii TaxID=1157608 RepID=A0ABQ0GPY6_9PEZI